MSEDDGKPTLPADIWPALAGKLWHATHIDKALAIIADGQVRPDADAKHVYGYCRSLGGVSLFDFRHGDANAERVLHCGWTRWLGGHHADDEDEIGIWFEIDPTRVEPHIAQHAIYDHYLANRTYGDDGRLLVRDPMPRCEACHIGPISLRSVRSVLLIDGRRLADHETAAVDEHLSLRLDEFRTGVLAKPPLPKTMGDRMREARLRYELRANSKSEA